MKRKWDIFFLASCIMLSVMPVTAKGIGMTTEKLGDVDSHTKTSPSGVGTGSIQTEGNLSEEPEEEQQEGTEGEYTEPPGQEETSNVVGVPGVTELPVEEETPHRTEPPDRTEPPSVEGLPRQKETPDKTEIPNRTGCPGQERDSISRTNPPRTEGDSNDSPKDGGDDVGSHPKKTGTAAPQTTPDRRTRSAAPQTVHSKGTKPLSTKAVEAPEKADSLTKRDTKKAAGILLNKEQRKTFFDEYPWIPIMLKVLLCILLTCLVSNLSKKMWHRNPKNNTLLFRKFIFNILQVLIYLVGGLCAVGQIPMLSNVVRTVLAGSGIFALAVSLSAQESIKSILGGFFITIFKPIEVGDRITLVNSQITGDVEDITLRHTIIRTFTNTRVIIPNATVNNEIIENSNIVDTRASSFVDVWVAYESDIDLAMEIVAGVIGSHPLYLDIRTEEEKETVPKVAVFVRELGGSGVALRASMWTTTVSENFTACSEVRLQIKKSFDAAGIEIPYTKYTILHQEEGKGV